MSDTETTAFQAFCDLRDVCEEYLAELASPAPDYLYRQELRRRMADRLARFKEMSEPLASVRRVIVIDICRVCGAPATIFREERIPAVGKTRALIRTGWCDEHFPGVEGGK